MKILRWFTAGITILGVIGFLAYEHFKPHYHTPALNPHPKYFLTIEGTVAPKFRGIGHLVFMAQYTATKDPCFHETNVLAGMVQAESRTQYYWVTPDKDNHYKIKIPIDKYKPGVCGWIPWTVAMNFVERKKNVIQYAFASIEAKKSQKYNPKEINYICSEPNFNSCSIKVKDSKAITTVIHPGESYTVQLNIKYQETS